MSTKTATIPPSFVQKSNLTIALAGNPNSGKSTLFNLLTGLNQKVGNYPGVTVERKSGKCMLNKNVTAEIIDLPGTYSIYPRSSDEQVVTDVLLNRMSRQYPDLVVMVADLNNLERNLLLFTQIQDLGIPAILVLNMADLAQKKGIMINTDHLSQSLGNVPVVKMNARNGEGLKDLKKVLSEKIHPNATSFYDVYALAPEPIAEVKYQFQRKNYYEAYLLLQHFEFLKFLSPAEKEQLAQLRSRSKMDKDALQIEETKARYKRIQSILNEALTLPGEHGVTSVSEKIDRLVTHRIFGYLIFFGILFFVFQAIFTWATVPMDFIDYLFSQLSELVKSSFPEGVLTNLLAEGILPGIGGIVIFVPQIAILFTFIAILEATGYMARVVFLMDKVMRKAGLNGRSVVPLISGLACAVPAIMATRGIDNWKDRLITIFVTPFMSCSARLPVYTILIALVVPNKMVFGFINLQGLTLMGMYLLGFAAAMVSAILMKLIIRAQKGGFLIMELPIYRWPRWSNVFMTAYEKSKTFVLEAGKIILAVSIVLWVLASYGPGNGMEQAEEQLISRNIANAENLESEIAAVHLENSYAGIMGKWIEPAIEPLGYDWKIGIALITSFAAREVFVGTMATLYSVGEDFEDESTIKSRMKSEINPDTGGSRYTPAVAFSLLVFYAFAMQCMSTVAIVYRETNGWKWPLLQIAYMTILAYISALFVYQILS